MTKIKQMKRKKHQKHEKKCKEEVQKYKERKQTKHKEITQQEQKESEWTAECNVKKLQKSILKSQRKAWRQFFIQALLLTSFFHEELSFMAVDDNPRCESTFALAAGGFKD